MAVYKTQDRCFAGCRAHQDNHIEVRRRKTQDAIKTSLVICKKHLKNAMAECSIRSLYDPVNECALCGSIKDRNNAATKIDIYAPLNRPYAIEPIEYIIYNIKALWDLAEHVSIAKVLVTECASFLDSCYYSVPKDLSIPNFTSIYDFAMWLMEQVESYNVPSGDRATIYGITYAELKTIVLETVKDDKSNMHPSWDNLVNSGFLMHPTCINNMISLDWRVHDF